MPAVSLLATDCNAATHAKKNYAWNYLFGTSVPNFGAPLGMVMVVGAMVPGLELGEESMLPLDWKTHKQD